MSIKIKEKSLLPKECIEKLRTLAKHLKPEDSALEHEAYCEDLLEQIKSLTRQLEAAEKGLETISIGFGGDMLGISSLTREDMQGIASETLAEMEKLK